MTVSVKCPRCGAEANVPDANIGKRARCSCGEVFIIQVSAASSLAEVSTFTPSPRKQRGAERRVLFSRRTAVVYLFLLILFVSSGLWLLFMGPSEVSARNSLVATTKKFDGEFSKKVMFWLDLRDAGHTSWAEVDSIIEFRYRISKETKASYQRYRSAAIASGVDPKRESSAKAAHRLLKANEDFGNWDTQGMIAEAVRANAPLKAAAYVEYDGSLALEIKLAYKAWMKTLEAEANPK